MSANGNKPFLHHNLVTWHFKKYKVFFFWILSSRWTICHHFQENWSSLSFSPLYNLNTNLWPFTTPNVRTTWRIWKIITFLEFLSQGWRRDILLNKIQALLIFDPLITLWGHFEAPYFKMLNDARVASACLYVRTCQRVRNSKNIATIHDFHLPSSFFCLSTRLVALFFLFFLVGWFVLFLFWCVYFHKSFKYRKISYKMIFQPEHAEDISNCSVYLLTQIFGSVSDFFAKETSKRIWPLPT